jgi:hypothetical protein
MILISSMSPPPAGLLEQSIKTGNTEALAEWYIGQTSPGYSFQTIAEFVEQERSKISKPRTKRAPSGKSGTREETPHECDYFVPAVRLGDDIFQGNYPF